MLARLFPYSSIRVVRLYYAILISLNAFFIAGVWYFVWRHFMSVTQVGLSDGLTFGAGFLFELPSGVWADVVGRHTAVRLGFTCLVVGNAIIAFGSSFWAITGGFLIWTIGYTFQSGALDALVYDNLLADKQLLIDDAWPTIVSHAQMWAKSMSLVCTLLGGFAYVVWFRLPWILCSVASLIGLFLTLRLPRDLPQEHAHKLWHAAAYKGKVGRGILVVFHKQVRALATLALLVGALDYALTWGILRPLVGVRFGLTAATLPVLQVVAGIAVIAALYAANKAIRTKRKISRIIGWGALLYGLSFVVLGFTRARLPGAAAFILVEVVSAVLAVAFSIYVNRHTLSVHRATTLSTVSLLERTPYAFLAILLGWLGEKSLIGAFCMMAGGLIVVVTLGLLPKWAGAEHEAAVVRI